MSGKQAPPTSGGAGWGHTYGGGGGWGSPQHHHHDDVHHHRHQPHAGAAPFYPQGHRHHRPHGAAARKLGLGGAKPKEAIVMPKGKAKRLVARRLRARQGDVV